MKKIHLAVLIAIIIVFFCACSVNKKINQDSNSDISLQENDLPTPPNNMESKARFPIIKDNIKELDDSALQTIAFNYLFSSVYSLNENEVFDYEQAFNFFCYAGFYRNEPFDILSDLEFRQYYNAETALYTLPAQIANDLVREGIFRSSQLNQYNSVDDTYVFCAFDWSARPELGEYFSRASQSWTCKLPAQIVEDYVLGKFNTVVDRSRIDGYNEDNNTYTIEPAGGSFHYSLSIEERTNIDDTTIRFICNIIPDADVWGVDAISHRATFTISFSDGEYSYLSVINADDEISHKLFF